MPHHSKSPENPEEYDQYLQYIADLDMTIKEKYDLLHILNSILLHFVHTAFDVQTDQITLQSVGKFNSNTPLGDDRIDNHPENQTAHAQMNGVESDSEPRGSIEP